MHKLGTKPINRPSDLDNQITTYLNIDPESGFAPMEWQAGSIGTVVVARKDRKPLLVHHLEGVWMYCDSILDRFGEGMGAPRELYNRPAFERWWRRYCEEQRENRTGDEDGDPDEEDPDDWRVVRSPFEV
jgi:hypothetical protein